MPRRSLFKRAATQVKAKDYESKCSEIPDDQFLQRPHAGAARSIAHLVDCPGSHGLQIPEDGFCRECCPTGRRLKNGFPNGKHPLPGRTAHAGLLRTKFIAKCYWSTAGGYPGPFFFGGVRGIKFWPIVSLNARWDRDSRYRFSPILRSFFFRRQCIPGPVFPLRNVG